MVIGSLLAQYFACSIALDYVCSVVLGPMHDFALSFMYNRGCGVVSNINKNYV